jgi:hypothetical protein
MPKQFKGQVVDNQGNKLEGVKVIIAGTGVPSGLSTTTDSEGQWLITLEVEVNSIDITITFSKSGFGIKSITNPQPTSELDGYIDPEKGGILDLAGKYPSGKWKVSSLPQETQNTLNLEIKDIYEFISHNPGNYKLIIDSSESKVPNDDNEDGKIRANEFKIPGALAKARATDLKEYVDKKLYELYSQDGSPTGTAPVVEFGIVDKVGGPDWDGVNAADNKYTQHQYTRVKAEFITTPSIVLDPECFTNFKVQINYTPGDHVCNDAVYKVYINDTLLYRDDGKNYASLNNKTQASWVNLSPTTNKYKSAQLDNSPGDTGGARTNQFTIDQTLAKKLLENFEDGYVIAMECYFPNGNENTADPDFPSGDGDHGGDCHKGIGTIVIVAPDGSTSTLNVRTPEKNGKIMYLAELDPCNPLIFSSTDLNKDLKKANADYLKSLKDKKTKVGEYEYSIELTRKNYYLNGSITKQSFDQSMKNKKALINSLLRNKTITKEEYNYLIKLMGGEGSRFKEGSQLGNL